MGQKGCNVKKRTCRAFVLVQKICVTCRVSRGSRDAMVGDGLRM